MKPGRELDALVAEALGIKRGKCESERKSAGFFVSEDRQYWSWSTNCRWCGSKIENGVAGPCLKYPFSSYSTDVAAAWQVDRPDWVWEFQETSHDLTVTLYPSPQARIEAMAGYPILPEGVTLVRREWLDDKASTYAWVRCLAALLAVDVEI